MEIHHATQDGCVIATFTGSINLFSVSAVQRTLLKDLAEQPYGLICDLSGVEHLDPVCLAVFATVVNHPASRWPATGFALCCAHPQVAELLGRLRVPDFLPVYASVDEALDAVFARPPYLRDELLLAPTPTAPAAARAFVRRVCRYCRYWELALPDNTLEERAVLVADELVTNAVVHARTELRLRLELRGDLLHLAVRDGSPRLLRLVSVPDPEAEGGPGVVAGRAAGGRLGGQPPSRRREGRLVHPQDLIATTRYGQLSRTSANHRSEAPARLRNRCVRDGSGSTGKRCAARPFPGRSRASGAKGRVLTARPQPGTHTTSW